MKLKKPEICDNSSNILGITQDGWDQLNKTVSSDSVSINSVSSGISGNSSYIYRSCGCTGLTCNCWNSSSSGNVYTWPQISTSGTITITNQQSYMIVDLPEKSVPQAVYVNGRMVTLGILGSDAECAYANDNLIFAPGVLQGQENGRMTLIMEFKKHSYHYSVDHEYGIPTLEGRKPIVSLISKLKR